MLKHIGSPEDTYGIHFDLLLEDKDCCRTWRLSDIPLLDGPYVGSVSIAPHNLYWLDVEEKTVSGNRGFATRIKQGVFWQSVSSIQSSFINLSLIWDKLVVGLVIDNNGCRIFSKKK